ncbi:MFS transporter [Burkholderia cenocepacia]|uniref:MFS transporter n=1 Tax=Burkholderia cenocepacia TaxID=95486 RepID=A0ABD4UKR5_9BURK|nr:MFS transporter [Burkholderia cenocepacia]MCW3698928.1 MFS transporter [Burkholderia cenocepacia]MCW3706546.1 MFS transporter [Burkholderia cenocepacia]MCW3714963.1 MFS transporter [Burkholderia cenocepacia]MCW3722721.1 MFS transporter [Burkholderia cenocepacia]MCW3729775.1 MFS transporter [Burkholderia cenocepacia]
MNNARVSGRDTSYEWKIVALLALGFGLVGVDRFMIMPLFPVMMRDLKLDYQDLGHITAALSVAWGVSALLTGNLSDRFGHRKVILPAMLAFSLLACASGLAWGVGSLMAIRAVMGFAEGAYTPSSITATLDASDPARHGRNVGIQQAALPLLGLGIAPILVTQLMRVVPWHWIFAMVALPGLVVCALTWKVLRDTSAERAAAHTGTADAGKHHWRDVLRYRNVPLCFVGMLCWLTCLIVLSALLPNYLTDYLHLGLQQMGFVLSATGIGGTLGGIAMPALSDRIGRRPVMVMSVLGAFVSLWWLSRTGADPVALFAGLLATIFFVFAMITLTVGPISAEAVPARLMTTASGLVIGVGEIFGGGIAPSVAGYVAKHFGIQYIMQLGMGALVLGLFVALALKETAPARRARAVALAEL